MSLALPDPAPPTTAPRVGLVLGAGGIVGQAFHAGVLAALHEDLGWDARTADVVVGTSAGSVCGAALRLGVPPEDLARVAVHADPTDEGATVLAAFGGADGLGLPDLALRSILRPWRLPSRKLIGALARRPWAFRPSVAAMTLVPHGRIALADHLGDLTGILPATWPDGLLVCAARADTGTRTVFGRPGAPPAALDEAVAASCAIPGYFRPVEIGGVRYLDGAVRSPTNADVLRAHDLDLVIVSSPMSAAHGRAVGADAVVRYAHHRRLQRELRSLRAAGTPVVVFEPDRALQAMMGLNAMAEDRSDRVLREAFFAAGARATGPLRDRLAPIVRPRSARYDPVRRTAAV